MVSFGVLNHHLQEGQLLQFLLQSSFPQLSHLEIKMVQFSSYVLLIRLDGYSMQLSCSLFCLGTSSR